MGKIKLESVSYGYQEKGIKFPVINDINITIKKGEFVSIIGPSGCGKSTLLSLLSGLNLPSKGSIFLDGRELVGTGTDRGIVFQHYSLFPWMSARKNIIFGLKQVYRDKSRKELTEIADRYLELVGLKSFVHKYPNQLSGGMQQRVAIARAFAMDSDILLMDEPFSAVDAKNRLMLQELLLKLWDNGQEKKTVVFVTHDVDEAILLSDRIIIMAAGTGKVKKEVEIKLKRPRKRAALVNSGVFSDLRNILISSLYDDLIDDNEMEVAL